jgi:transposase-like protein
VLHTPVTSVANDLAIYVTSKAAYTCLGVDLHGYKELLGLWIGEAEGASFWLTVLTELRNRGIKKILIACIDGLKGFPDAIQAVFPETEIQLCIIHQLRNTLKYVVCKDRTTVANDLKTVYKAPTEEAALFALEQVEKTWLKKYALGLKSWRENWSNLSPFFKYPAEIRKIIYTTNAVESLHRQFRKITKTKSIFPHDEALKKSLFLAYRDLEKKWSQPIKNWSLLLGHLSIIFEKQLASFL